MSVSLLPFFIWFCGDFCVYRLLQPRSDTSACRPFTVYSSSVAPTLNTKLLQNPICSACLKKIKNMAARFIGPKKLGQKIFSLYYSSFPRVFVGNLHIFFFIVPKKLGQKYLLCPISHSREFLSGIFTF